MTTVSTDSSPSWVAAPRWVGVATLVALLVRLPWLNQSIWFDEACMSDQRIGTWPQLLATLYVDIHPPLFVAFMYGWNTVFGDSEVSMRLPALVSGLLTLPLTFAVGRRFVGDRAAMIAVVLLALSPVHVWYSIEARLYAPMMLASLLCVGSVHRLLDGGAGRGRWVAHAVLVAGMLALHYYLAVYVLLLAGVAVLGWRHRPRVVLGVVLVHGLGLLGTAVFVAAKLSVGEFETEQGYLRALTPIGVVQLVLRWCWTGNTLCGLPVVGAAVAWWVFQVLGGVLLVLGAFKVCRRNRAPASSAPALLFAYTLAIPAFLLACSVIGLDATYIERSCLSSLPFLFLIAAAGLDALRPPKLRLAAIAATVGLTALSLAALLGWGDRWTVYKPHPDWRSTARYLGAEIDAGAAGRPVFTTEPNPRSLAYYDARIQDAKNLAPAFDLEQLAAGIRRRLGATVADYAHSVAADFEAHNAQLLARAKLLVYPATPDVAGLRLADRGGPGIAYLVRDHWRPPRETTVKQLLGDPRITVRETHTFAGLTVYKLDILP